MSSDEFKGTLANLREAGARTLIVVGEANADQWFPFQGTISVDEDSRDVLAARRIPTYYLGDPAQLETQLRDAFEQFSRDQGPMVLLATQAVLESSKPLAASAVPIPEEADPATEVAKSPADAVFGDLDTLMAVINQERIRLVWQVGDLSAEDGIRLQAIAERAGIALVDSLQQPGTVSKYRGGLPNPNYLGTLGIYGLTSRVYFYLHHNGHPRPTDEQALLFLNSKIPQASTPFPESRLKRKFRTMQVVPERTHQAPMASLSWVADPAEFLRAVEQRLNVNPDVLDFRRRTLAVTPETGSTISDRLPTLPMSPNYFFLELSEVFDHLIRERGWSYTGI